MCHAGLVPPALPPAPRPSGIKPPAHWLVPSPSNDGKSTTEDESKKDEIYEDLRQFFNSSSTSSVVSIDYHIYLKLNEIESAIYSTRGFSSAFKCVNSVTSESLSFFLQMT